jgi:hypothetical protein
MGAGGVSRRVDPIPRPRTLDTYDGLWVAVDGDDVIAAAETSHALALQLHSMDHRVTARAVVEFVRPAGDAYIVGVG